MRRLPTTKPLRRSRSRVGPTYAGRVNEPDVTKRPPADRRLRFLASFAGLSWVVATFGTVLVAGIAKEHPAILLALSSRNRNLLLVKGTGISALAFFVIPFLRLMPIAIVYYLLGRDYGDRGKQYLEREAGGVPGTIKWAERVFDRIGPVSLLLFAGSQLAWLLAGLRRVSLRTMVAWEAAGIAARLAFFWLLGERFKPQIESALKVIQRFQWPLTVLLIVTIVFQTSKTVKRAEAQRAALDDPDPAG
jgi:membrane protein DedA with SNARE-associated domain